MFRGCLTQTFFLRWLFFWVLVMMAGFYWLPSYKAQANAFYAGVLAPFILFGYRYFWDQIRSSQIIKVSLVFVLYFGLSGLWSVKPLTRPEHKGLVYIVYIIAYLACIRFLYQSPEGDCYKKIIHWSLIVSVAVLGPLSAILFFSEHKFFRARLEPLIHHHNTIMYAQVMGVSALLALLAFLDERRNSLRLFLILAAILAFCSMFLTMSRGPMLGFVIAMLVYLSLTPGWRKKVFIIGGFCGVFLAFLIANDWSLGRLENVSDNARLFIYKTLWGNIADHSRIIFGMGLSNEPDQVLKGLGYAHSMFVAHYYFGGVVGAILFFSFLGYLFISSWR